MRSFNLQNTNSDTCIKFWNKIVLDGVIKQILLTVDIWKERIDARQEREKWMNVVNNLSC